MANSPKPVKPVCVSMDVSELRSVDWSQASANRLMVAAAATPKDTRRGNKMPAMRTGKTSSAVVLTLLIVTYCSTEKNSRSSPTVDKA